MGLNGNQYSLYDYDENNENELGTDEEEQDLENEEDERGVSFIIEDEEKEKEIEDEIYYKNFPELNDIYQEGMNVEKIPEEYNEKQIQLFKTGIKKINEINKKHGCSLNFTEIVNHLNRKYDLHKKNSKAEDEVFDSICMDLWKESKFLAIVMEKRISYSDISSKKIESDLVQNFKDISQVIRLYPKIYPEKFPTEYVTDNEYGAKYIFNSKGKLRKTFKMNGYVKFDVAEEAYTLKSDIDIVNYTYFGSKKYPKNTEQVVTGKLNEILGNNINVANTQGERVRKLAECVRLLRPLQARREQRSVLEYFTNHDVYVTERDTLRKCKKEMLKLGLNKKEISKVLHGGTFNDVKFLDGMTVKEKLLHPESKDVLLYNRIPNDSSYDLLPGDDNLLPNNEINLQRNSLVIDDLDDKSEIMNNEIKEEEISKVNVKTQQ